VQKNQESSRRGEGAEGHRGGWGNVPGQLFKRGDQKGEVGVQIFLGEGGVGKRALEESRGG